MKENIIPIQPVKDWIFIDITDKGERVTKGGIIIPDDDFKEHGIRPREILILAVNERSREYGLEPGQRSIVPHGEWTRKIGTVTNIYGEEQDYWGIEYHKIEIVSDQ
jgi:co-chaperonin GroES (HSP10)